MSGGDTLLPTAGGRPFLRTVWLAPSVLPAALCRLSAAAGISLSTVCRCSQADFGASCHHQQGSGARDGGRHEVT